MAHKVKVALIFQILTVIVLDTLVYCIAADPKLNFSKVNTALNVNSAFPSSTDRTIKLSPVKKWQVGRVSRKHYEIVNMLWRKTKIFINPETTVPAENRFRRNTIRTTSNYEHVKPLTYNTPRPSLNPSTASYIEFYYLDDNDERVKRRDSFIPTFGSSQRRQQHANDNIFLQSPVLSFHVNDHIRKPNAKETLQIDKSKITENLQPLKHLANENPSIYGYLSSRFKIGYGPMLRPNPRGNFIANHSTSTLSIDDQTCPSTTLEPGNFMNTVNQSETITYNKVILDENDTETTVYDKIKFFEIYDDHTVRPLDTLKQAMINDDDFEKMVRENEIIVNQKSYLEDIHRSIGHYDGKKVKNVKKHVEQNVSPPTVSKIEEKAEKTVKFKTVLFHVNKTATENRNSTRRFFKNSSRVALWSDYPFAAVYVYEPSQIHCDAAALSPHWLIAAGSCLSRFHSKDPESEGRSAFVAYCGQRWWRPERLTYVKYSIVHPRFHPKDTARRYLYNIGLVQVVGSMSSCNGWAPISLMSHHFAAGSDGSIGTAVGWGVDRYDVRYSPVVLPKLPLSAYDSFVYSESCPGSTTFGKDKFVGEESTVNIYCLSLPPYHGEQNDPVHGSLLLVGGKLIALYLQEERRIWGEQSAQYTGVWRLVPWVNEVAREPDEGDGFGLDL